MKIFSEEQINSQMKVFDDMLSTNNLSQLGMDVVDTYIYDDSVLRYDIVNDFLQQRNIVPSMYHPKHLKLYRELLISEAIEQYLKTLS